MFTARRTLIASVASLLFIAPAVAQQGRGPVPPREARGVVKSVDAKARILTVTTTEGGAAAEKQFTLAKDAEIALGDGTARRNVYQAGRFDDLVAGAQLSLTLADDDTVSSVLATGPGLRGLLKSIDADKRQITVESFFPQRDQSPEAMSYVLAAGVEVVLDDGRGRRSSIRAAKLAELAVGSPVQIQLSANQKEVLAVVAEGPTVTGTVKSIDAAKKQLTLAVGPTRPGEEPSEQTIEASDDATVWLDDGRGRRLSLIAGKLADVPAGSLVRVRLTNDQKQAVQITAEGPTQGGLVKAVDAEKRTITVALFTNRGEAPEEKTLEVAADARIMVNNEPAKLDDVKPADNGPFANFRLSLDQKAVQFISIINR